MTSTRRLASLVRPPSLGTAAVRTATVVDTDTDAGTATVSIPSGDGVLEVEQVRYASGITPQVGAEVAIMMNGSEPFILSETGSTNDPVFTGRVQARGFTAVKGDNLLELLSADTSPWEGWDRDSLSSGSVAVSDTTNDLVITTSSAIGPTVVVGPEVPVVRAGRYTASVVVSTTPSDATSAPTALVPVWIALEGYDANGAVVQTIGGDLNDYPRGASPEVTPSPVVSMLVDPAIVQTLQTVVYFRNLTTGVKTFYMRRASINSAPSFDGGVLSLGDTSIDPGGFTLAGERITSPWNVTVSTTEAILNGGTMTTRWQRVGRTVHFSVRGTLGGAMGGSFWLAVLPLPPNNTVPFAAMCFDASVPRYHEGVALTDPPVGTIGRVISNGTQWSPTYPMTWALGDWFVVSGTYEID